MKSAVNKKYRSRLYLILMLLLGMAFQAHAQVRVSGKVTDINNEPLPGASILLKGTTSGTVTDLEGNYSIMVPGGNAILVFAYVGYTDQEIPVGNRTSIDITLEEDITRMEEVVVIGYGTQKKIDLSGTVAVVDAEELQTLPIKSAGEALKGRAPGVYVVSNTGQPGSSPTIRIRGTSSITAGNDPLIIVDGVQGVSLSDIDFNDIVSYNVLIDAAAAAIYGSAGANGVILITTRRGKGGQTKVDFNFSRGWQFPPEKLSVLSPEQSMALIREIDVNKETASFFGSEYRSAFHPLGGSIDTTKLINTDWQGELFRVAPTQNYSLSVSGGEERFAYRLSAGYLNQVGYIKPSEFQRFTVRSNLDYNFSDNLKMQTDISIARKNQRTVPTGDFAWNGTSMLTALNTLPFIPIYNEDGGGYFVNPFQPNIDTPPAGINGNVGYGYSTDLVGRYGLGYEILPGLKYQFDLMARVGFDKGNSYRSRYHTDLGRQSSGTSNSSSGESFRWDMNHILSYTRSFGSHNLELMGGLVTQTSHSWGNSAQRQGFPTDSIPHAYFETRDVGTITVKYNGNSSDVKYAKYSYIGRLNYNYASRYYLQVNFRADGSARFGKNYRWGTFPSASVAWRLSEEPFMQNLVFLSNLKLRATYGVTGNDAFSNFQHLSTYSAGANYPIWGTDEIAVGYAPSRLANPDLRWEETTEKAIGLDMTLWKGRLDMVLNGFIKDSKDLLYNVNLPAHTGFSTGVVNIGQVRVNGVEFQLTTRNVSRADFSWRTTLTISRDKNEVVSLGQIEAPQFIGRDQESVIKKGLPINAMWGWIMEGIFQNQGEIDELSTTLPDGTIVYYQNGNTAPGDIQFANTNGFELDSLGNLILDQNGNPFVRVDDNDRTYIGKPNPDFHFGMDNAFRYKNLEFSFFFQGMYGNDILSLTRREIERMDHYFNFSSTVANRWMYEGQDTDIPRATISDPNRNNSISTRWLEDGSFIRLKYVTLAYNLPENLIGRARIRSTRVFVTAENMLTFTKYTLYDPEIATNGSRGLDMGGYPQARTLSFGVNLGF